MPNDFAILWSDRDAERHDAPFPDGWRAFQAAAEKANEVRVSVKVLRPDGTVFATVQPGSWTWKAPVAADREGSPTPDADRPVRPGHTLDYAVRWIDDSGRHQRAGGFPCERAAVRAGMRIAAALRRTVYVFSPDARIRAIAVQA